MLQLAASGSLALSLAGAMSAPALAGAATPGRAQPSQTKRKVGIAIGSEQFAPPQVVELGVLAEHAGFDGIWLTDHIQPWQANQQHAGQAWVMLSAIGSRTSRLLLGTGVTTPTFRYHPAVVAQAFATLGALYPSRVFLGIGAGEALNELASTGTFAPYRERAARAEEAVGLIRRLWTGEMAGRSGPYYPTENTFKLWDLPPAPVPMYIAGSGPKSATMAGRLGDGWITDGKSALDPAMRAAFTAGVAASGRDPASIPIRVESFVVVGGVPEADDAATLWRFSPIGFAAELYNPDPTSIEQQVTSELSAFDVWRNWTVNLDPQDHIDNIRKHWDAGVDEVWVHSGQQDQARVMDFYARQVLPHLSR
ncbi:MAG: TIGR03557 family F420-dependent LLM class oxidoreductase [Chloroflexi bacterium]|nr:TIGR03557 family F420-dependent LLM class oxidoreductase [Chloroflexota bacterium]